MNKECGNCTYKYSCGYSSIRRGLETGTCVEPHLFQPKLNGMVWSYKQQTLVPEAIVKTERRLIMEYAKGEWEAGQLYIDGMGDGVVDIMAVTENGDNREWVAETWNLANARLIASAPDLYEACKTISAFYSDTGFRNVMPSMIEAVRKINQAIAKANAQTYKLPQVKPP